MGCSCLRGAGWLGFLASAPYCALVLTPWGYFGCLELVLKSLKGRAAMERGAPLTPRTGCPSLSPLFPLLCHLCLPPQPQNPHPEILLLQPP